MSDHERLSNELADRLDAALPPHLAGYVDIGDEDPLVQTAARLANAPHPELSPEMLLRIQGRVLEAAEQQVVRGRISRFPTAALLRVAAVLVIAFLSVGTLSATVPGSVPGDVGYPIKRGLENVEFLLVSSPDGRASVYLTHAERRVSEAQALLERGQFDQNLLIEARTNIDSSNDILVALPTDARTEASARAGRVNAGISGVAVAAMAANLVVPEMVVSLLPTPTMTSTVVPTDTSPATWTPTASPTITPESLPTSTPLPTAVPTDIPPVTVVSMPGQEVVVPSPVSTSTPLPTDVPPSTVAASATPGVAPTLAVTPSVGYVNAERGVNMRKGPGQQFEVIVVVQPATQVEIVGESADRSWYEVRLPGQVRGWIAASLISRRPPAVDVNPDSSNGSGDTDDAAAPTVGANASDCAHPGSYCNAPGQQRNDIPGDNGANPGPAERENPSNDHAPPGQDNKPPDPGPPEDRPGNDKGKP